MSAERHPNWNSTPGRHFNIIRINATKALGIISELELVEFDKEGKAATRMLFDGDGYRRMIGVLQFIEEEVKYLREYLEETA